LPYPQWPQAKLADSRQPQFRMQKGDDPPALPTVRQEALRMPSPGELGLGATAAAKTSPVDSADVRRQMERLGMTNVQLERTSTGYRVTCVVPAADGPRRLTADAVTEAEAIHQALARAELLR
jgi:hypothetical protein